MGIKIGDVSMLGGAITGKGLFGKGLGAANRVLGPMAGVMPRMAESAQKKAKGRAAAAAEVAAMRKAEFDAKRNAASGMGGRGAPIMSGDVDAMMGRSAQRDMSGMKKGGNVKKSDIKQDKAMVASAVHKHERAKHKGQPLTKMAKGGSTASKRGDGCASKGKTKGRFV